MTQRVLVRPTTVQECVYFFGRWWWFAAMSYVPGTRPWRFYRDVVRWSESVWRLVEAMEVMAEVENPELVPVPTLPRNPHILELAIADLREIVEAVRLTSEGRHDAAMEFLVSD